MSQYPNISVDFEKSIQSYTLYYNYSEKQKTIIKCGNYFVKHKIQKIISLALEELNEIKNLSIDQNGNFQGNNKDTLIFMCIQNKEFFRRHKVLKKFDKKSFLRLVIPDMLIAFDVKFMLELKSIHEKENFEDVDEVLENKIKLIGSNLENLSVGEWREQLEIYDEAHSWVKGIFGIHNYFEYMQYFDSKSEEFRNYIFHYKLKDDYGTEAAMAAVKKLNNEYYSTQIGSRWKKYLDQIPEEIITLITEFGDAIGSKLFLLFCIMNKKTPLYFATKIINLHQFFPNEIEDKNIFSTNELSINKLSSIYNRIIKYFYEVLKKEKKQIKYIKYLNNDQSRELKISTNDLKIDFDNIKNYKITFKDNKQKVKYLYYLNGLLVESENKKFIEKLLIQIKQDNTITIDNDQCITGFSSHEFSIYSLKGIFLNKQNGKRLIRDTALFFPNFWEDDFLKFGHDTLLTPMSIVMKQTPRSLFGFDIEVLHNKINELLKLDMDKEIIDYSSLTKINNELFVEKFKEIVIWINSIFKVKTFDEIPLLNSNETQADYRSLLATVASIYENHDGVLKTSFGLLWKEFSQNVPEEVATLSHLLNIKFNTLIVPLYCLLNNKNPDFFAETMFKLNKLIYGEDSLYENKYLEYFNSFDRIQTYLNVSSNKELEEIQSLKESINLEFKTSFNIPYGGFPKHIIVDNQKVYKLGNSSFKSHNEIKKFIQKQSLKAIAAFLNTKGGQLIIGLYEEKENNKIVSIVNDDYVNDDKYIRNIIQQINNRIGTKFSSEYIDIEIKDIEDNKVCTIDVEPYHPLAGEIPAYLDEKELYRRTGPRNDKVPDGPETGKFIIERMSKT